MKQVYVVYDAAEGRDVCAFVVKREAEGMAEALDTERYAVTTLPLCMCGAELDSEMDEYGEGR